MERRIITQLLNKAGVTLEENSQKELVDSLLDVFHEELDSQRDLTQASNDKAKELSRSLNELQKKYDQSIRNSEDLDALKSEIQILKNEHKQELQKIEINYNQKLLNSAIETALTKDGARNNKGVAVDTLELNDVAGGVREIETYKPTIIHVINIASPYTACYVHICSKPYVACVNGGAENHVSVFNSGLQNEDYDTTFDYEIPKEYVDPDKYYLAVDCFVPSGGRTWRCLSGIEISKGETITVDCSKWHSHGSGTIK